MAMSNVFPRSMKSRPPVAVSASGCYITDQSGKVYLDGSGGAAVSCLGHGHPAVVEALKDQASKLAFAHTGFFSSEPAEALASCLATHAPGDLDHVYFVSGGSEAVEGGAETRAPIFHRERPAGAPPVDIPPPELSRQYAWGAGGWRQYLASAGVRAAVD